MTKLMAVSQEILDDLRDNVEENLDRYLEGDFLDLAKKNGWSIDVPVEVDRSELEKLNGAEEHGNPSIAVANSLLVGNALKGLSPNLAAEERIWVRLSHIECLSYARDRWLNREKDHQALLADIRTHFFAKGVNGIRDDHAISRLWWNARIAGLASPGDIEAGLKEILKTTDYRMALVERSGLSSRKPVISAVMRAIGREKWLGLEDNHRAFQVALNRLGGGVVHEVMTEAEMDAFVQQCIQAAQADRQAGPAG